LESATGSSTTTHSQIDLDFDFDAERDRVREFFEQNGYMPAPRQAPDAARRRLRVIRRLGLEKPDRHHRKVLDRFTRLAVSIFKTPRAVVSVIGRDKQIFLSQIGFGNARSADFDESFCCHTVIAGPDQCVAVPDATKDWRFQCNPNVTGNVIRFYAGAPLCVGKGPKAAIIGSMCIIDDKPRDNFGEDDMRLLQDLAECAVSEVSLDVTGLTVDGVIVQPAISAGVCQAASR
jgi:GAF domain-containing protein